MKRIVTFIITFVFTIPIICYAQTDQSLIYASYFGGSDEENGSVKGLDTRPGQWLSGFYSFSTDMPITGGALQNSFAGVLDGFIGIFNLSGTLEYSTYIGGSGYDAVVSARFFPEENGFAVCGITESEDFPVTPSAYLTEYQGNDDCFVSSFDDDGQLLWSTYFGGEEIDDIKDMAVDATGAVYIVGRTNSTNLATDGVYQSTNEGLDAFLAKFNQSGNLSWCTYFGDVGGESFNAVDISPDGLSVYCGGSTNSTSNIAHDGWQNALGGYSDATLVSFDASDGTLNWSTYYGGTDNEECTDLVVAENGIIYFTGTTQSVSNIASIGAHQENLDGYSDAFLVAFDSAGNRQWATYFGGSEDEDRPELTLQNQDVILSGGTGSSNNISFGNPMDDGGPNGNSYIAKFDENGQILWGTYFLSDRPIGLGALQAIPNSSKLVGVSVVSSFIGMSDIITQDAYQETNAGVSDLVYYIFSDNTIVSTKEIPFYPLKIYPNPATSFVFIELPQNLKGNLNLEIYDAMGKRVSNNPITAGASGIDISGLSFGVYILTARTGKGIYRSKLIVE